uniref:Protein kinase domain-containing protein n=1 Tax=Steinernema glaseri TaxID=37863 RepID=A0A1I8A4E2_9BILA
MIIDLMGTPSLDEMRSCCEAARNHVLRAPHRPNNTAKLFNLAPQNPDAIDLLIKLLTFDPAKRINVEEALRHPYLEEGRMRFHSCMCSCCYMNSRRDRVYTPVFEPVHEMPFDPKWEKELCRLSMFELRDRIYRFITERTPLYGPQSLNPVRFLPLHTPGNRSTPPTQLIVFPSNFYELPTQVSLPNPVKSFPSVHLWSPQTANATISEHFPYILQSRHAKEVFQPSSSLLVINPTT